jgi:transmembrane sensor
LRLEAGEVHVQVAKDPQRPLSVLVGGHVVQALGTAFNIELRPDLKIELVVTEGSVRLGPQVTSEEQSRNDVKIRLPDSAKVITAGQEVVMNQGIDQAMPISESEIQVRLSWQKGNLVFRGETLAVAVQEVERYTGVEFIFLDESLKEVRVSGFFRAGDVDGMLAVLKENFDISFQHESETRVLLYSMRTPDSQ